MKHYYLLLNSWSHLILCSIVLLPALIFLSLLSAFSCLLPVSDKFLHVHLYFSVPVALANVSLILSFILSLILLFFLLVFPITLFPSSSRITSSHFLPWHFGAPRCRGWLVAGENSASLGYRCSRQNADAKPYLLNAFTLRFVIQLNLGSFSTKYTSFMPGLIRDKL